MKWRLDVSTIDGWVSEQISLLPFLYFTTETTFLCPHDVSELTQLSMAPVIRAGGKTQPNCLHNRLSV